MLTTKSYSSVLEAKRRKETASAFGTFWQQGNADKKIKSNNFFERHTTCKLERKKRIKGED